MTDNTFTDREIQFHFDTINEKLDQILAQTTKTNGRVTIAEKEISILKASGRIANWAFGLTIPIIMALCVWIFFNQIESLKYEIERHEKEADTKLEILYKQFNLK